MRELDQRQEILPASLGFLGFSGPLPERVRLDQVSLCHTGAVAVFGGIWHQMASWKAFYVLHSILTELSADFPATVFKLPGPGVVSLQSVRI